MASASLQASTTGPTQAYIVDLTRFRFGIGLIVTVPATLTATWTVEVTGDNPNAPGGIMSNWNPHDLLQSVTGSANGNVVIPVTGIRLNVGGISGTGAVNLAIIQGEG